MRTAPKLWGASSTHDPDDLYERLIVDVDRIAELEAAVLTPPCMNAMRSVT